MIGPVVVLNASRPEMEYSPRKKAAKQDSDVLENFSPTSTNPNNATPHPS